MFPHPGMARLRTTLALLPGSTTGEHGIIKERPGCGFH
jgi:hypothetical protein